jgi:hypothetical protein
MSYERITRAPAPAHAEAAGHFERAAYQVLALIAPFLVGDARTHIEALGERYL